MDLDTGAILGLLMGLFSLTMNTLGFNPASYLFSPFVPHGNLYSLLIALVPRILIRGNPLLRLSLDPQSYRTYGRWDDRFYDQYCIRSKRDLLLLWEQLWRWDSTFPWP